MVEKARLMSTVTSLSQIKENICSQYENARKNASKASQSQKHYYDQKSSKRARSFKPGDLVWYFSPRRYVARSPKLQKFFKGPYSILKRYSDVLYGIDAGVNKCSLVVHIDKLKKFI